MARKRQEVAMPWFPGFYQGMLNDMMDRTIESWMEDDDLTWEEADAQADYEAARRAMSEAWVEVFNELTGMHLQLAAVESPKEYNFTTDRLACFISVADRNTIATARRTPEFAQVVKAHFTSYDGFSSFYSNDLSDQDWRRPLAQWDWNELGALLGAYVLTQGRYNRKTLQWAIYEDGRVEEACLGRMRKSLPATSR